MALIDRLVVEQRGPGYVFDRFIRSYNKGEANIYLFFEGKDDCAFYMQKIRSLSTRTIASHFECQGKKDLELVCERVLSYIDNKYRAWFFRDKDLDDFLGLTVKKSDVMFVTDYYSVENYLVNESSLRVVWEDLFHKEVADPRWVPFRDLFIENRDKFYFRMTLIMSWFLFKKKRGCEVEFKNIKLNQVFEIDDSGGVRRKKGALEYICQKSGLDSNFFELLEARRVARKELQSAEPQRYIRGKFDIWFFVKYVNFFKNLVNAFEKKGESGIKPRVDISSSTAIDLLGGRVACPPSLTRFIRDNEEKV